MHLAQPLAGADAAIEVVGSSTSDEMGAPAVAVGIGSQIEELTRLLSQPSAGVLAPDRVVRVAEQAVAHSQDCALTVIEAGRRPLTISAAADISLRVDELQYEVSQGPCLEASESADFVRVDDLAQDLRWPAFAPRCVQVTGVRSMLSVRVPLNGADTAALNFYSRSPSAFDDLDVGVGAILAPFAALAVQTVLHQQQMNNLEAALVSSRAIGTAVGILMARQLVTSEQAFAQLASASQRLNRKVRDIATQVVITGELPATPDRPQRRDTR